jgi:hypothetical protein
LCDRKANENLIALRNNTTTAKEIENEQTDPGTYTFKFCLRPNRKIADAADSSVDDGSP